jgi:predicted DNA-binding ribbon-helix-helix protein
MIWKSFIPAYGLAMAIGPASKKFRPDERSSLVIRNVKVHGHRTSVRLEPQMWDSMVEICRREFCTPDDVCSYVAERKPLHDSLSSLLRVFILDYFQFIDGEGTRERRPRTEHVHVAATGSLADA